VLIFSGLNNHDWRSTTPVIKTMFTDCARFGTVDVTENPAGLNGLGFGQGPEKAGQQRVGIVVGFLGKGRVSG